MGELMQQQADEEQGSSEKGCDPNLTRAPTLIHLVETLSQRKHDQCRDNEPAVVEPDLDS